LPVLSAPSHPPKGLPGAARELPQLLAEARAVVLEKLKKDTETARDYARDHRGDRGANNTTASA
jgi:hypothetical protein